MPPKKDIKDKQVKGDEAEEMVLQYLKSVNRPYASTDVSANLKNKVPKAAAQKVMQSLADKGTLTLKPYGKQTIFVYNQSLLPVLSPEEMKTLDEELKEIQAEVEEKKRELRSLEKDLSSMESTPKTKDLPREIERIKSENEATIRLLEPFRAAGGEAAEPMSPEEIKGIDEGFAKWRKAWVDRRKVYKELLGMLADGGMTTDASFEEEQGIIPDDDECKAIESGEFCQPKPVRRAAAPARAAAAAAGAGAGGMAGVSAVKNSVVKRSMSGGESQSTSQESVEVVPKKKKAKK